jgi:hypothetical protein
MINGVEILSTTEVATDYTWNYWLVGFIYIGVVIICGIVGYISGGYPDKVESALIGCAVGALLGLFVYFFAALVTSKPVAYETRYKVTISDSVSINEFLDKYEILDQEGKIYTVKERE